MREFDKRQARFDRDFAAVQRHVHRVWWAACLINGAFMLIILTILALVAYGLAQAVGLL